MKHQRFQVGGTVNLSSPTMVLPGNERVAVESFLQVSSGEVVACADALKEMHGALGVPELTTESRQQVDTGIGQLGEVTEAAILEDVLQLSPVAESAAGVSAAELREDIRATDAMQRTEVAAEEFHDGAGAATHVLWGALRCVLDCVIEDLRAELAASGDPVEQAQLRKDLLALTAPLAAEVDRRSQAKGREEGKLRKIRRRAEDLGQELRYQGVVAAVRAGETPTLEELQFARARSKDAGPAQAAPKSPAGKEGNRRGSKR